MPSEESRGYDIATVIEAIVDEGSFTELKPLFAPEVVTGFALLEGQPIGIVANQPLVKGGVLFVDSPTRRHGSSGSATPSTSRCSTWPMCLVS